MKKIILLLITCATLTGLKAQTPTDGLMMLKGLFCNVADYSNGSWSNYWEGATKRNNANIGTMTTQSVSYMGNLGVTDRLNVMVGLPYVWTSSSASYLAGQKGIQDLSLWLKYQLVESSVASGTFNVFATGGASIPVGNYATDFLPFSIGTKSKTASGRLILNYIKNGFYGTAQAGVTLRSKVSVDRNSFIFDNQLYETNVMPVPNIEDASLTLGYLHTKFQTAISLQHFGCLTGDDIRYNDMPQLTNNMSATSVSWFGRYNMDHFAVIANVAQVVNGRNVGQATTFDFGALYFFSVFNKEKPEAQK